ncbi:hypothetical protein J569_1317 [Acinetobacter sp. 907131]|nr:hypothetical protein J569_1317 [Acinetobacter sp. 907131]EXS16714.1 hypothetical protein J672_1445 [Acinetobacter sp. 883425]
MRIGRIIKPIIQAQNNEAVWSFFDPADAHCNCGFSWP